MSSTPNTSLWWEMTNEFDLSQWDNLKIGPELPYGMVEIRIPKSIIKMYKDSPYAGNLPTMTVLYTSGDEQDE